MTKTLTFLFASTALTAALALPAWSAMHAAGAASIMEQVSAVLDQGAESARLILVDDDEDDNEGYAANRGSEREDEDDDGCEEDEGSCGGASNPAPAGSTTPPQNGLFGDGAAPKAQVN